ncbi:MAG: site-2 protease family protein [Clostridia bacterium]
MKIKISPFFILMMVVFVISDATLYIFPIILSAAAHEMGHILAIYLSKGKISKIHILPFGAQITIFNKENISYKKEIIISASGVLVNFILLLISVFLNYYFDMQILLFMSFCNLSLMLINLVPIYPLDGGRILYAFLLLKLDIVKATLFSDILSLIFLVLLLSLGIYVFIVTGYNFSLLLIGVYLVFAYIVKSFIRKC